MATEVRENVSAAIAWTIISEITRRHGGGSDLRILELHPGGGQSHLLRLIRVRSESGRSYDGPSEVIGELDVISGTMRGMFPDGDENVPWRSIWLQNTNPEMVIDIAQQTFDLPISSIMPRTNRRIFGCRILAKLLASKAFENDYLLARMAFADTSGEGGGIAAELRNYTGIYRPTAGYNDDLSAASDCWLVRRNLSEKTIGVISMDGLVSASQEPQVKHDLYEVFQRRRSMTDALCTLQDILAVA